MDTGWATAHHVIAEGASEGGRFSGHVDPEHVVAIGHSAGGGTILGAASADDRIDGFVSMASGRLGDDTAPMPAVPSLFVAGSVDAVVSAETVTRPAFEAATARRRFADHQVKGCAAVPDVEIRERAAADEPLRCVDTLVEGKGGRPSHGGDMLRHKVRHAGKLLASLSDKARD